MVNHDFADYYSENPAGSFALQVWVNNSWVAAQCIVYAIVLGIPIPYVLFENAANLGVAGGLMFHAGKGDVFLGLLTPHGLLELTAVLLAAAAGMRLGWSVVSPGDRPRGQVLAEQGRAVVAVAVGLVVVLLRLGTHRGARHAVAAADVRAHRASGSRPRSPSSAYVVHFGRKAVRAGETGDVDDAPDVGADGLTLQLAAGLHRQVAVGQRGGQLLRFRIDDVDSHAAQPRCDEAAVVARPLGGGGVVHLGRIRAPGGQPVHAAGRRPRRSAPRVWPTVAAAPPSDPRPAPTR